MPIPTEPIGSIPRPRELIEGMEAVAAGRIPGRELDALYDEAVHDTIERFETTDSPVITDGEQRKPSFVTYPIEGLAALAPDGVTIPFEDGHERRLPRLTSGPFRYHLPRTRTPNVAVVTQQYWVGPRACRSTASGAPGLAVPRFRRQMISPAS